MEGLNARYFAGAIQAKITWGPRTRRRPGRDSIKLGSYSVDEQLIRIHPVLDAGDVPRFFVEWIIYHEMLHEVHDMPIVDGRRVYHTPEFRRAEALFERYAEAVLWERTMVHKLSRARSRAKRSVRPKDNNPRSRAASNARSPAATSQLRIDREIAARTQERHEREPNRRGSRGQ